MCERGRYVRDGNLVDVSFGAGIYRCFRTHEWFVGLTRALEGGHIMPPHLFFANNLKTAARSAAKFGIPAQNS